MAFVLQFDREPTNELEQTNTICLAAAWRSPGVDFVPDSDYRYLGFMGTDESTIDLGGVYLEMFGVPPLGSLVPCRAYTLNNVTGLTSAPLDVRALVLPP